MHGGQVGTERVEVVEGRARDSRGARGDLFVSRRLRCRRQVTVPVVGPVNPDDGENRCQRVDFA